MKRSTKMLVTLILTFIVFILLFLYIDPITSNYFIVGVYIINLIGWFSISISRKTQVSKLSWLLLISIIPFYGLLMYLMFGRGYRNPKRFKQKVKQNEDIYYKYMKNHDSFKDIYKNADYEDRVKLNIIKSLGNGPLYTNTMTKVLTNGNNKFPVLIESLENAREFIHFQYYIIREGDVANQIKDILIRKAISGVEVRVLYDDVGCIQLSKDYIKSLRDAGVKVAAFNKVNVHFLNDKINYRNHRKIVIIDGDIGFTGGLNIGDEYNHQDKYYGFWRDTHLYLEGPAVNNLQLIFAQDWEFTTGECLIEERYFKLNNSGIEENGLVQIVSDGPDVEKTIIKDIYFKLLTTASKSIWIATPYFIPDTDIMSALKTAARCGIDVKLLVPGKPDKKVVYMVTRSNYEELLEAGIKIYEYEDTFMHSKFLIIDGNIASIGTANMDFRSFHLNFEITAFLYNTNSVKELIGDFEYDLTQSIEVDYLKYKNRSYIYRVFEAIAKLFSPLM